EQVRDTAKSNPPESRAYSGWAANSGRRGQCSAPCSLADDSPLAQPDGTKRRDRAGFPLPPDATSTVLKEAVEGQLGHAGRESAGQGKRDFATYADAADKARASSGKAADRQSF